MRPRAVLLTVVGLAAAVAAGVTLWPAGSSDVGRVVATTHGDTSHACHQVTHVRHGYLVDTRTVDGATATAWLEDVDNGVPASPYADARQVPVCLTYTGRTRQYAVYAVDGEGRARLVAQEQPRPGELGEAIAAMQSLDSRWKGGAPLTDAPFRCPRAGDPAQDDVTTSLPAGATAVRLCLPGISYSPPRPLTTGVDALVSEIDAEPVRFQPSNSTCSGDPSDNSYVLVFRYPAGTRTVSYDTCSGLALGPFHRGAPVDLDGRLMAQLAQEVGDPPGSVPAPSCPRAPVRTPTGVGDTRNLVAARWCPAGPGAPGTPLTPSQLDVLRQAASRSGGAAQLEKHCPRPSQGWASLALADTWGNRFTMTVECLDGRRFPSVLAQTDRQPFHPIAFVVDRASQRLLRRLSLRP